MRFSEQFRRYWLQPILNEARMWSPEAEQLLMRTAAAESAFCAVRQLHDGPARGFFQMEDWVFDDLMSDRLKNNPDRYDHLKARMDPDWTSGENLERNIAVMILAARYFYAEIPAALPAEDDAEGQWHYYKKYWNTGKGATTRKQFDDRWFRYGDTE